MKIAVLTSHEPFASGGAERHAEDLCDAIRAAGHESELLRLPYKHYPPRKILDHVLAYRLLDLTETCGTPIDRVIALKFPAYLVRHPHKIIWLCHQHRNAYELWNHPLAGDLTCQPEGELVRAAIQHADTQLIPEAKRVHTISRRVSKRLVEYCGLSSSHVYHPPRFDNLHYCEEAEDYLYFPSRLNLLKRQALVLNALAQCRERVRVLFSGGVDHPDHETECMKIVRKNRLEDRAQLLGQVSEEEKRRLYARSIGVLFPPVDEDYGYVTLEAMLSSKPVITCEDSGGPLEFVDDGVTGLIAEPTPKSLAAAMDRLWKSKAEAAQMGRVGRERYEALNINWPNAIKSLLQ